MKIDLYNRAGNSVWLEQVKGEWWQLRMDPFLFNYTRLIFEEGDNQKIYAVDPPGGPFIQVGQDVGGGIYIVKEIKNTSLGIFLQLGENKKV